MGRLCPPRARTTVHFSRSSRADYYDLKYAGYVQRQQQQVERQKRLEHKRIPVSFDYLKIQHLRFEAREKLTRIRPITLAQAGRISGITPADMELVLAHLEGK